MNKKIDGSSSREIDFYWRPGCPFCMSLESKLKKEDILEGIKAENIGPRQKNPFDIDIVANYVKIKNELANGNETVPTINVNGTFLVNPSMKEVVKLLS